MSDESPRFIDFSNVELLRQMMNEIAFKRAQTELLTAEHQEKASKVFLETKQHECRQVKAEADLQELCLSNAKRQIGHQDDVFKLKGSAS